MAGRYRCGAARVVREGSSVMKRERCVGSLHRPLGDCLRPIVGGLLCYGYLDRDEGIPLEESMEGPRPLLFPSCALHRPALVDWAEHLWGDVAEGVWVPPEGFERTKRFFEMERDPVVLSPDPATAVRIVA